MAALEKHPEDNNIPAREVNFLDMRGDRASLSAVVSDSITDADRHKIVEICSQPLVYDECFREIFDGRPYSTGDADYFVDDYGTNSRDNGTAFVYLVRDSDGVVVAALDIKSANRDGAEIGYWADSTRPGFMTNAVTSLCIEAKNAGYRSLTALTVPGNDKSSAVLVRAGFELVDDNHITDDNKVHNLFEIKL
jgi:RimJ/RimL family protein N-acetyltransferase